MRALLFTATVSCATAVLATSAHSQDKAPAAPAPAEYTKPSVTSSVEAEATAVTWQGTRGVDTQLPAHGKGSQLYTAVRASTTAEWEEKLKWELSLRSGYAHTRHSTFGQKTTVDTPVDTQFSSTFTMLSMTTIQPFFGFTTNLPTGESYLPGQRRFARMDPDLAAIGSYGEGLNVNPTAGFNYALTSGIVVSPSISYTWRNPYFREGLDSTTDTYTARNKLTPGDLVTGAVNSTMQFDKLNVDLTASYSISDSAKENEIETSRTGSVLTTNARFTYQFTEKFSSSIDGSWTNTFPSLQRENEYLVRENKNSNSQLIIASFRPVYVLDPKTTMHLNYSYMFRDRNYYDIFSSRFVPAKTKHSVGGGIDYALTTDTTLSMKGSRFWVEEAGYGNVPVDPTASLGAPTLSYTGWQAIATIQKSF